MFTLPRSLRIGLLALTTLVFTSTSAFAAEKLDVRQLSEAIDQHIGDQLDDEGVEASPLASDEEFLRRIYLDLIGKIPTAAQAAKFLDSKDSDKRAKLIDELLASSEFGKRQADVWQGVLLPQNSDNRRLVEQPLVDWLSEQFNQNRPWDKLSYDLLTASGPQDKNGATTYWIANATADKMTDSVCSVFLGVQLQCAQCHNHPFTDWKQDEYWEMAAFFMKVQTTRVNQAARKGASPTVSESPVAPRRRRGLPESAKMLPPKFLQAENPEVGQRDPLRPVLAKWIVDAKNPYFSKAMVNRTWALLFGRGFVNPIDDMRVENPASHPELLEELATQFAANGFDVKDLYRAICNSETYQRTSMPMEGNEDMPETLFARMNIKVLTPGQLYDSLMLVLGQPGQGGNAKGGKKKPQPQRNRANQRDAFITSFGLEEVDPIEYQAGIPQALQAMNAPQMNRTTMLNDLFKANKKPAEMVEHLYLSTLSRRPRPEELQRITALAGETKNPRETASDVLWVLLNCSEFVLNR